MEENRMIPTGYRKFAVPFCLISLIFFGIWPVFLFRLLPEFLGLWNFNRAPEGFIDLLFLFAPLSAIAVLVLLCLIGAILLVCEMKAQSLSWKSGIPLCALCCVFILSAIAYDPPYCCGQITPVSGMICYIAFMSLPLGVNLVLREFSDSRFDETRSFSKKIGFPGLFLSVLPVLIELQDLIPYPLFFKYQLVFTTFFIVGIFVNAIVVFGLMPMLGIRLFRLGLKVRQIFPAATGPAQS